ncbi:MAG: hypothetical protein ACOC04_02725 [Halothece sp.]
MKVGKSEGLALLDIDHYGINPDQLLLFSIFAPLLRVNAFWGVQALPEVRR